MIDFRITLKDEVNDADPVRFEKRVGRYVLTLQAQLGSLRQETVRIAAAIEAMLGVPAVTG